MTGRRNSEQGFSLLEVLAAFTILSLFITAAFQAFFVGTDSALRSGEHMFAQMLAHSSLEALAAERGLTPGEKKGQVALANRGLVFRWRTVVTDYVLPDRQTEHSRAPLQATVEIAWGGASASSRLELRALLLGESQ